MREFWTPERLRLAGVAGIVGGLGWAALAVAAFAAGSNGGFASYDAVDALTPVALLLTIVGLLGYRARTKATWSRLSAAGFVTCLVGLTSSFAGAALYGWLGVLYGWELLTVSYLLALVGAAAFGAGLLRSGTPPRFGTALLAAALPVGLAASFGLAVAALGWFLLREKGTAYTLNS